MAGKKTKKWYDILASKEFNEFVIGETLTSEPKNLIGRNITVNLGNLTNDIKNQNTQIIFLVDNVKESEVATSIIGYELSGNYIKRVIKKAIDKILGSLECETQDKIKIRIKYMILMRNKAQRSVLAALSKKADELIKEFCEKNDYNKLIISLLNRQLNRDLKENLKKINPIGLAEIKTVNKLKQ